MNRRTQLIRYNNLQPFGSYFNAKDMSFVQFACYLHILIVTLLNKLEIIVHQTLSLAQYVAVASGCSSKCPQLQFRQSELSVFQCFDGSPGSGHLSVPLSFHLQPAVGGMTHTKTNSLSSALAFSVLLK